MNIKRVAFMAVLVLAVAALAIPMLGLRASASGSAAPARPAGPTINPSALTQPAPVVSSGQESTRLANGQVAVDPVGPNDAPLGKIAPETLSALGIHHVADPAKATEKMAAKIKKRAGAGGDVQI